MGARRNTRRRGGVDLPALRADLRAAVPDATAALVVTVAIFVWLYARVRSGSSPSVTVMPFMAEADTYVMYWLCQAFGWSALLWAWVTTMLGLLRSGHTPGWFPASPARLERWHRTTSLTTVALMFLHAALFFAELVRENRDDKAWVGRLWSAFVRTFVPGGYDSAGNLTTDAAAIEASQRALPVGYWKGSGLAIVLDMIAAMLSGGLATHQFGPDPLREAGQSQIFLTIDPSALATATELNHIADGIIDSLKQATPIDPAKPIRYPGEQTLQLREENLRLGVPVDPDIWNTISGPAPSA